MQGASGTAASRLLLLLLLLCCAAESWYSEASSVAANAAVGSRSALTATAKDLGDRRRCLVICGAAAQRDGRSNADNAEVFHWEEEQCGLDLQLFGLAEDWRVIGMEVGVGLAREIPADSAQVLRLEDGGPEVGLHQVFKAQRGSGSGTAVGKGSLQWYDDAVAVGLVDVVSDSEPAEEAAATAKAAFRRRDSMTFRFEACGLSPRNLVGRRVSVLVVTSGGDREIHTTILKEAASSETARSVEQDFSGASHFQEEGKGGGSDNRLKQERSEMTVPRSRRMVRGRWETRRLNEGKRTAVDAAATGDRRMQELEACSADCLDFEENRCENWPDCEFGGLGCNAENETLCRYCGFEPYEDCADIPSSVVPTPSPTQIPDREECSAPCLDASAQRPCFDDPTCLHGDLLGCNANGDFYCRFCGFSPYNDCPFSLPPTPAPLTTAPVAPPAEVPTTAPVVAPLAAPTLAPTLTPTAAPTSHPTLSTPQPSTTAAPTGSPTAAYPPTDPRAIPTATPTSLTPAPSLSPSGGVGTAAPSDFSTAAPTGAPTVAMGELGTGAVRGYISAVGVPDELVDEKGQELLIQEAVCALITCLEGLESVVVDSGVASTTPARSLAQLVSSSPPPLSFRKEPPGGRQRRLADVEQVQFLLSTPAGAPSDETATGSKQAAAFINQIANATALQAAAGVLGVEVDDLEFEDLAYFEGADFQITFTTFGSDSEEESSTWATILVSLIIIGVMCLCSCCILYAVARTTSTKRVGGGSTAMAVNRDEMSLVDAESGSTFHVRDGDSTAYRGVKSSTTKSVAQSTSTGSKEGIPPLSESSALNPPKVDQSRTQSIASEGNSSVEKFTYVNPMLGDEAPKKTGSPIEYGDDLARHYKAGSSESSSTDLSQGTTNNPLFLNTYSSGPVACSPASVARASHRRGSSGGSGGGGGTGSVSQASWRSETANSDMETDSSCFSGDTDALSSRYDGSSGSSTTSTSSSAYQHRGAAGGVVMSTISEASFRRPFGLSPVVERAGETAESDMNTSGSSSTNTTGGASSVYHARGGEVYRGRDVSSSSALSRQRDGGGGGGRGRVGGAGLERRGEQDGRGELEGDSDDDMDIKFRAPSPGVVKRPLQPLLAQHSQSPLSSSSDREERGGAKRKSFRPPGRKLQSLPSVSQGDEEEEEEEDQSQRHSNLTDGDGLEHLRASFSISSRHYRGTSQGTAAGISDADFLTVGGQSVVSMSMTDESFGSSPGTVPTHRKSFSHISDTASSEASADAAGGRGAGAARSARVKRAAADAASDRRERPFFDGVSTLQEEGDFDAAEKTAESHAVADADTEAEAEAGSAPDSDRKEGVGRDEGGGSKALRFSSRGKSAKSRHVSSRRPSVDSTPSDSDVDGVNQQPAPKQDLAPPSREGHHSLNTTASTDAPIARHTKNFHSLDSSSSSTLTAGDAAAAGAAGAAAGAAAAAVAAAAVAAAAAETPESRQRAAPGVTVGAAAGPKENQTMAESAPSAVTANPTQASRSTPDDVRKKAIQAGAAAAAAAAQAQAQEEGGGNHAKALLKRSGSSRSIHEHINMSFAEMSTSGEYTDDEQGGGAGGMWALRQHLADPSMPSGSYRRQGSEDSLEFSDESQSPTSTSGLEDDASAFSVGTSSSFAAGPATAANPAFDNMVVPGGGGGGGGTHEESYRQSVYGLPRGSTAMTSSRSESFSEQPLSSYQRHDARGGRGRGDGQSNTYVSASASDRPLSWTSTAEMEEQEEEEEAMRTKAGAVDGGDGGFYSGQKRSPASAAAAHRDRDEGQSSTVTYKKMFAAKGSSSSSGEAKRRMVMR